MGLLTILLNDEQGHPGRFEMLPFLRRAGIPFGTQVIAADVTELSRFQPSSKTKVLMCSIGFL